MGLPVKARKNLSAGLTPESAEHAEDIRAETLGGLLRTLRELLCELGFFLVAMP